MIDREVDVNHRNFQISHDQIIKGIQQRVIRMGQNIVFRVLFKNINDLVYFVLVIILLRLRKDIAVVCLGDLLHLSLILSDEKRIPPSVPDLTDQRIEGNAGTDQKADQQKRAAQYGPPSLPGAAHSDTSVLSPERFFRFL